jgi:hypothetical protein
MSIQRYNSAVVPRGAQQMMNSLATAEYGSNLTAIYNEGTVVIPTGRRDNSNVAVYNAPGGTVLLASSHNCKHCGMSLGSNQAKVAHERMPGYCRTHNMCFESWTAHNAEYGHYHCGVSGCGKAGVDFGSDARYLQHFRHKHNYC